MIRLLLLLWFVSFPALAEVEKSYNSDEPFALNYWIASPQAENLKADLDFIKGMRPHHEGALPMSREYLGSKKASSLILQKLAKGIIHNQQFEIDMMNNLEKTLKDAKGENEIIAKQGLAQKWRFVKMPAPGGFIDRWNDDGEVSARDVAFAKAMIVHHEGALVMAQGYLDNPHAENGYLRLLCLDILRDQSQEIGLMKEIIGQYKGDADKVKASPIYGMEHMNHKGHHKVSEKKHSMGTHHH